MAAEYAPVVIATLAGFSVAVLVIAIFRGRRTTRSSAAQRRMVQFASPEDLDPLERSFAERVLRPIIAVFVRIGTGLLPGSILGWVERKIEVAGRPTTANQFVAVWLIVGVGIPLAFALLFIMAGAGMGGMQAAIVVGWMLIGLYLPSTWLRRKARQRAKQVGRDLPDAIDLIITNIEAGLGMQAALLIVSEKFGGPLGEEFGRVVREISVGAERTEALVAMSERTGVPEMRLFGRAVAQAEQTGIPVARVLRNHSAEVREKRRQLAREQAAKIPVKITFPTVLIVFPTLFLLILGPVAVAAIRQFALW
jgi:tight adherence protein C